MLSQTLQIKELESQLLIERKLARQHVDTKIAEQHQQQEQFTSSMKPPLSNRQPGNHKNDAEPLIKDLVNVMRPLTENNSNKPQFSLTQTDLRYDTLQKENKPETSEEQPLPRRTGRASICTTARRIPVVPAPRRNSLIPFPATATFASLPPLPLPLPVDPIKEENDNQGEKNSLELTPRNLRSSRKISSILRRSVQKKVYISPLHQHIRRGGAHGAMEKVRVSIGSRGRLAQRVLVNNANRAANVQQKMQQKDKERGWNHGTTVKGGVF